MAVPAADYRPSASAVVGNQTIVTKGVGCDEQKDAEMIAVIFEVWPKTDRKQDYLDIAAELKPLLAKIDGFISISGSRVFMNREKFCRFHSSEMKRR